ncbi:type 4a pilus biogenesis protein PilO [Rubrobacter calidifluminis]|uniref:type 4a pilus biogenesis protein PilO n=1 Tax=Rubrobacter calidifluminis TaxID=1392640 RepID=UPI002361DDEA|nr:type 4a pilus biogenesis protein PilO [Rubrobacter calidifluminis]
MNPRDRNILIGAIVAVVLVVVAYYVFLLGPARSRYARLQRQHSSKQAELARLESSVAHLNRVKQQSPRIQRQLLQLDKRLPNSPQIPTLLVQLQEISRASGVTQLSIKPGSPEPPVGGGDFSRIPITMSFEGSYDQMQDFYTRLLNLARLVSVTQVTYQPAGGTTGAGSGGGMLQVQIEAEVYVQPPIGQTGGGSAPPAPVTSGGAATGGG